MLQESNQTTEEKSHQGSTGMEELGKVNGRRDSGQSTQQGNSGELQAQNSPWPANRANEQMMNGGHEANAMNGSYPMDYSQMMQMMPNGLSNPMLSSFPNMMGTWFDSIRFGEPETDYLLSALPNMGMDPMAMSQAMTQSMYEGFGGLGMGMNGMNMGMGFNAGQGAFGGYNGQVDTWTSGQDNYNANAFGATGMGGNFGAHAGHGGHGGYNVSSHQGNYNQMNQQHYPNNDFQNGYSNHGFQYRGRGRRGGYYNAGRGRDVYNQMMHHGNQNGNANYEAFHHQVPLQITQQNASSASAAEQQQPISPEVETTTEATEDVAPETADKHTSDEQQQMMRELNPGGDDDDEPKAKSTPVHIDEAASIKGPNLPSTSIQVNEPSTAKESLDTVEQPVKEDEAHEEVEKSKPLPIQTFISSDDSRARMPYVNGTSHYQSNPMPPPGAAVSMGPTSQSPDQGGWGRGFGRGFHRGMNGVRGDYRGRGAAYLYDGNGAHAIPSSTLPIANTHVAKSAEPKGLGVEGAPTGPKALREGLPNTSIRGGRGFSIVGRASTATQGRPNGHNRSRR